MPHWASAGMSPQDVLHAWRDFECSFFAGALLYAGYLVFHKLVLATPMDGWTSVMVSIWLLGGMIISFVGLIGIYLSKVFSETKQRPSTIIRAIHGQSTPHH